MYQVEDKRPNILLIMCDQMRGDCMGIAGHPDVKTPFLDSLAAEGSYFPNAYSACPSCIPARAALFTGQSQRRHGRVGYRDGVEWTYPHMLPQELGNGGYHTECVGKLHVHPPLHRCGFHNLTLHDGYIGHYRKPEVPYIENQLVSDSYLRFLKERCGQDADVNDTGLECNSWVARPWIYDEMSHPTNWAVTESIDFLRKRDRSKPFFLMTSFVRPHPPLDAPQCYFDMYNRMELTPPAMGDWVDSAAANQGVLYDSPEGCRDGELRRQAMVGYYACITHMDHQIGRLLQALYRDGCLEDTIIVFTSDHGELLFDHGMFRKVRPYQGSVRIPLIIRGGKNLPAWQSQPAVCTALAELRDLMPTLLEIAGCPIPRTVDGLSLLPAIQADKPTRDWLHGEHSGGALSNHYIVTPADKYIWFSQTGQEQYFRLGEDPREEHDLLHDPAWAGRVAELRGLLAGQLADRPEGYVQEGRLVVGRTPCTDLPHCYTQGEMLS